MWKLSILYIYFFDRVEIEQIFILLMLNIYIYIYFIDSYLNYIDWFFIIYYHYFSMKSNSRFYNILGGPLILSAGITGKKIENSYVGREAGRRW